MLLRIELFGDGVGMIFFGRGVELGFTNIVVFFEAVRLEEVGELEGADITTPVADFLLEVGNDLSEVIKVVAVTKQLVPHALAVEA